MNTQTRLLVAGYRGMVGAAVLRRLRAEGYTNLLLADRNEVDFGSQARTLEWFERNRPEVAFIAAARVGGIHANNTYPADFIRDNLAIALNCIESARLTGVQRLLFLGSSCIYPKHAPQPMPEDCLLASPLEPTNEAYAIAKIAGLKLCQYYRRQYGLVYHSAMPTNLFGPGDNYHPRNSHVLPALIRRFHEAKESGAPEVVIWGTGSPRREFLHVDDLAGAVLFLLQLDNPPDWINVGCGVDVTIRELAEKVMAAVGYTGRLEFDATKPDGTPRKLMDVARLATLGWRAGITLDDGIRRAYASFLEEKRTGVLREV
jgi:GDP-L-fucose synthase